MECPNDETLTQLVEGGLTPERAAEVGAHTESCSACRHTVIALVRVRSSKGNSAPATPGELDDDLPIPLGSTLGRYQVRRFVGAGAMGLVFEAEDPALKRRVALKVMRSTRSESAQALLQHEAVVMARLSHRNVAAVLDVGRFGQRAWVAMEFIDGLTLRAWLSAERRDAQAVRRVLLEAGRGLQAAHAAGVLHRDFKPDNVLVEKTTGRAVVTDFGLAVVGAPVALAVVGTPAYMPPEARKGEGDARGDQFSFCVTAVEALTGQRPFDQQHVDERVLAQVPASLRGVLRRGLEADPGQRWPSLEPVLTALGPPRRERWVFAASALLAVITVGAIGLNSWRAQHACDDAASGLAGVWSPAEKSKLEQQIRASGLSFSATSASVLIGELDRWAARWTASANEACQATLQKHTQSDTMLDLRRGCLGDRLTELRALLVALEAAPPKEARVEQVQANLPDLDACDDSRALLSLTPPPSSQAQRALVEKLRAELATVSALRVTGEGETARRQFDAILSTALDAGYRPLEADVLVEAGSLALDAEDFEASTARLQEALVAAEAGGHVRAAARGWIVRALVDGVKRGHVAEGHHAASMAAAASERLGRPLQLEADLATNLGTLLADEGKHAEARAQYEAALEKYRQLDASPLVLSQALNAIGAEVRSLGDVEGALEWHRQALELVTARYSAHHPATVPVMINLGNVHLEAGRLATAVEWYEKAQAVLLESYGPDSLELASVRSNLGGTLLRQGKLEQAEPLLREALATVTKRRGEDSSGRLAPLNNLAILLRFAGKLPEAGELLEDALRVSRKVYGETNEQVANALINLGDVQLAKHDYAASVRSYEDAIAITEKTSGPEHPNLADCWGGLAFPLLEQREWARALAATEKAQAIYAKHPGQPYVEAIVHVAHARALYEVTPARRAEARAEAKAARSAMEGVGAQPEELAEVDRWLDQHR
ncbi:MAG: serine/threonine-protein kinase [Myxococcaceae bacterium]